VHHFFRRHVYSASKNHLSRPLATLITFLISALAHELVMGCITRKFRGYGFFAMMLQMPIVMVQRSKYVKGRTLLNNVLFWCSMVLGLSMVSPVMLMLCASMLTFLRCARCTSLYRRPIVLHGQDIYLQPCFFWCFRRLARYPSLSLLLCHMHRSNSTQFTRRVSFH
jgi:hypothetical protein